MVECPFCGEPVKTNSAGYYQELTGWGLVRDEGGVNSLKHKRPTGRYAHAWCVKYSGRTPSLFDDVKQEAFDLEATKRERYG